MSNGVTYINPASAPKPGTFSHVAIAEPGRIAYVAGQTSVDMSGTPVSPGDFAGQIPVVYGHLGRIFKEIGADFSDVLQYTTYLVGTDKREAWQKGRLEMYKTIYPNGKYPPNTLLIVNGLAKPEYLLEISAIVRLKA
jgi:enamine deaminase RidA (YjgF/YER057c/UK114 family)